MTKNPPTLALLGLLVLIVSAGLLIFTRASQAEHFTDGEPLAVTPPPSPRNDCERIFAEDLFINFDTASRTNPPLTAADLEPVLDACTGEQLVAADRYFEYTSGGPMTALRARRHFNGPGKSAQFAALCKEADLAATRACTSQR